MSEEKILEQIAQSFVDLDIILTQKKYYYYKEFVNNNVTLKQQTILIALIKKDLTVSELAKRSNSTVSSLSQILSKMEKSGYIKRYINTDNRRETFVTLSDKGLKQIEGIKKSQLLLSKDLFSKLDSKQLNDLYYFFKSVISKIEED